MGVYLKGVTKEQLWKVIVNSTEFLPDYCEIVEVETPHGRLGDLDKALQECFAVEDISLELTIIEAEVE